MQLYFAAEDKEETRRYACSYTLLLKKKNREKERRSKRNACSCSLLLKRKKKEKQTPKMYSLPRTSLTMHKHVNIYKHVYI